MQWIERPYAVVEYPLSKSEKAKAVEIRMRALQIPVPVSFRIE